MEVLNLLCVFPNHFVTVSQYESYEAVDIH